MYSAGCEMHFQTFTFLIVPTLKQYVKPNFLRKWSSKHQSPWWLLKASHDLSGLDPSSLLKFFFWGSRLFRTESAFYPWSAVVSLHFTLSLHFTQGWSAVVSLHFTLSQHFTLSLHFTPGLQSSVCILLPVCILLLVCSLQSCILHWLMCILLMCFGGISWSCKEWLFDYHTKVTSWTVYDLQWINLIDWG